ncbi:hypothetical protein KY334_02000 [Candidatus Woesearchaeota archaeon]|nr:hypothetical protein [Candidatus Woesearchaeota archaeon]
MVIMEGCLEAKLNLPQQYLKKTIDGGGEISIPSLGFGITKDGVIDYNEFQVEVPPMIPLSYVSMKDIIKCQYTLLINLIKNYK